MGTIALRSWFDARTADRVRRDQLFDGNGSVVRFLDRSVDLDVLVGGYFLALPAGLFLANLDLLVLQLPRGHLDSLFAVLALVITNHFIIGVTLFYPFDFVLCNALCSILYSRARHRDGFRARNNNGLFNFFFDRRALFLPAHLLYRHFLHHLLAFGRLHGETLFIWHGHLFTLSFVALLLLLLPFNSSNRYAFDRFLAMFTC